MKHEHGNDLLHQQNRGLSEILVKANTRTYVSLAIIVTKNFRKTMKQFLTGWVQERVRSCGQEYCWLVAAAMINFSFFR